MVLAAGCGGSHRAAPKLPRTLAVQFARAADAVAAAYDAGDTCGAQRRAVALQRSVTDAINRGQIPDGLQEPLSGGVNDLVARSSCTPPPPPPPPARRDPAAAPRGKHEHDHDKHQTKDEKKKDEKKHGHEEGDE